MTQTALSPLRTPLIVLLFFVTLAACGEGDETPQGEPAPEPTAGEPGEESPELPGAAPERIAAVLGDGSLAMLDAESGEVQSILLEDIDVSDPAKNGIATTPDGDQVFVVRPATAQSERHEIVRVSVDGGEPEVVANGRAPAVSPDGETLVYVESGEQELPPPDFVFVFRDLDTGEERRLHREQEEGFHFIVETEWTADGEQLAFVAGEIKTGLYLLDADAEDLDQARFVGPEAGEEDVAWTAVAPFEDQRLAVVETCCDLVNRDRWHVVAVNPQTGEVEAALLPEERVEASRVSADQSARHLLLVSRSGDPSGGTLLRWSSPQASGPQDQDGAGSLRELRQDVIVAAW